MKTKNLLLFSLFLGLGLAAGAVLVLSHTPTARAAGPWYVSPSGDDSDCLSWGTACTTINGAIAKASSGDTINIGAGTYIELLSFGNITLTLTGAGADTTFVDGGGTGRTVYVGNSAVVTITGVTIQNGQASGDTGGGVYIHIGGRLTLANSVVYSNTADYGAGIYTLGILTLDSSAIISNVATTEGGGLNISSSGTAWIENCTISHNAAEGWSGGMHVSGAVTVTHSTIAHNIADSNDDAYGEGGGIGMWSGGQATFKHTLIGDNSGNSLQDCAKGSGDVIISQGYNLLEHSVSGGFGCGGSFGANDITGQDPLLGPLQDNGGDTPTHALLEGSPAINAGDPAFSPPPEYDQRGTGFPRVIDGRIDIGAYEYIQWLYAYLPLMLKGN